MTILPSADFGSSFSPFSPFKYEVQSFLVTVLLTFHYIAYALVCCTFIFIGTDMFSIPLEVLILATCYLKVHCCNFHIFVDFSAFLLLLVSFHYGHQKRCLIYLFKFVTDSVHGLRTSEHVYAATAV